MLFIFECVFLVIAILIVSAVEYGYFTRVKGVDSVEARTLCEQFAIWLTLISVGFKFPGWIAVLVLSNSGGFLLGIYFLAFALVIYSVIIFVLNVKIHTDLMMDPDSLSYREAMLASFLKASYILGFVHFLSSFAYRVWRYLFEV